jgi:PBP1b-binding outer membrane lipoprotein LpoB
MTITITKTKAALVAGALLLAGVGGCASFNKVTQPFKDAPRSSVVNRTPADVIEMPDGFNNVATKCDHGNRIYVSYHGDGTYGFGFAVPNDPTCG